MSTSPSSQRKLPQAPSRTQEERSSETRAKLLEATIVSIAESGLAATTSRRVSELAGVSSGAQTYHFPHRTDLLGAAVEHLARQRIGELRRMAPTLPKNRAERLETLLDLLWRHFNSTTFVVFVKLWAAAQDDPELHARLIPVEQEIAAELGSLYSVVLGEIEPYAQRRLIAVMHAVRGLALTEQFEPRAPGPRETWPDTRATMLEILLAPARDR